MSRKVVSGQGLHCLYWKKKRILLKKNDKTEIKHPFKHSQQALFFIAKINGMLQM